MSSRTRQPPGANAALRSPPASLFTGLKICLSGFSSADAAVCSSFITDHGGLASRALTEETSILLISIDEVLEAALAWFARPPLTSSSSAAAGSGEGNGGASSTSSARQQQHAEALGHAKTICAAMAARAANPKYQEALRRGIPIVRPAWLAHCAKGGRVVLPEVSSVSSSSALSTSALPPPVFEGPLFGHKVSTTGLAPRLAGLAAHRAVLLGGLYSGRLDESVSLLLVDCLARRPAVAVGEGGDATHTKAKDAGVRFSLVETAKTAYARGAGMGGAASAYFPLRQQHISSSGVVASSVAPTASSPLALGPAPTTAAAAAAEGIPIVAFQVVTELLLLPSERAEALRQRAAAEAARLEKWQGIDRERGGGLHNNNTIKKNSSDVTSMNEGEDTPISLASLGGGGGEGRAEKGAVAYAGDTPWTARQAIAAYNTAELSRRFPSSAVSASCPTHMPAAVSTPVPLISVPTSGASPAPLSSVGRPPFAFAAPPPLAAAIVPQSGGDGAVASSPAPSAALNIRRAVSPLTASSPVGGFPSFPTVGGSAGATMAIGRFSAAAGGGGGSQGGGGSSPPFAPSAGSLAARAAASSPISLSPPQLYPSPAAVAVASGGAAENDREDPIRGGRRAEGGATLSSSIACRPLLAASHADGRADDNANDGAAMVFERTDDEPEAAHAAHPNRFPTNGNGGALSAAANASSFGKIPIDCRGVRVWLIGFASAAADLKARTKCLSLGITRLPILSPFLCSHIVVGTRVTAAEDARLRQWVEAEGFPTNCVVTAQWLEVLAAGVPHSQSSSNSTHHGQQKPLFTTVEEMDRLGVCRYEFMRRRLDAVGGGAGMRSRTASLSLSSSSASLEAMLSGARGSAAGAAHFGGGAAASDAVDALMAAATGTATTSPPNGLEDDEGDDAASLLPFFGVSNQPPLAPPLTADEAAEEAMMESMTLRDALSVQRAASAAPSGTATPTATPRKGRTIGGKRLRGSALNTPHATPLGGGRRGGAAAVGGGAVLTPTPRKTLRGAPLTATPQPPSAKRPSAASLTVTPTTLGKKTDSNTLRRGGGYGFAGPSGRAGIGAARGAAAGLAAKNSGAPLAAAETTTAAVAPGSFRPTDDNAAAVIAAQNAERAARALLQRYASTLPTRVPFAVAMAGGGASSNNLSAVLRSVKCGVFEPLAALLASHAGSSVSVDATLGASTVDAFAGGAPPPPLHLFALVDGTFTRAHRAVAKALLRVGGLGDAGIVRIAPPQSSSVGAVSPSAVAGAVAEAVDEWRDEHSTELQRYQHMRSSASALSEAHAQTAAQPIRVILHIVLPHADEAEAPSSSASNAAAQQPFGEEAMAAVRRAFPPLSGEESGTATAATAGVVVSAAVPPAPPLRVAARTATLEWVCWALAVGRFAAIDADAEELFEGSGVGGEGQGANGSSDDVYSNSVARSAAFYYPLAFAEASPLSAMLRGVSSSLSFALRGLTFYVMVVMPPPLPPIAAETAEGTAMPTTPSRHGARGDGAAALLSPSAAALRSRSASAVRVAAASSPFAALREALASAIGRRGGLVVDDGCEVISTFNPSLAHHHHQHHHSSADGSGPCSPSSLRIARCDPLDSFIVTHLLVVDLTAAGSGGEGVKGRGVRADAWVNGVPSLAVAVAASARQQQQFGGGSSAGGSISVVDAAWLADRVGIAVPSVGTYASVNGIAKGAGPPFRTLAPPPLLPPAGARATTVSSGGVSCAAGRGEGTDSPPPAGAAASVGSSGRAGTGGRFLVPSPPSAAGTPAPLPTGTPQRRSGTLAADSRMGGGRIAGGDFGTDSPPPPMGGSRPSAFGKGASGLCFDEDGEHDNANDNAPPVGQQQQSIAVAAPPRRVLRVPPPPTLFGATAADPSTPRSFSPREVGGGDEGMDVDAVANAGDGVTDEELSRRLDASIVRSGLRTQRKGGSLSDTPATPRGTELAAGSAVSPLLTSPTGCGGGGPRPVRIYVVSTVPNAEAARADLHQLCLSHATGLSHTTVSSVSSASSSSGSASHGVSYAMASDVFYADIVVTDELSWRESVMMALCGGAWLVKPSFIDACRAAGTIVGLRGASQRGSRSKHAADANAAAASSSIAATDPLPLTFSEHEWSAEDAATAVRAAGVVAADAPASAGATVAKERAKFLEVITAYRHWRDRRLRREEAGEEGSTVDGISGGGGANIANRLLVPTPQSPPHPTAPPFAGVRAIVLSVASAKRDNAVAIRYFLQKGGGVVLGAIDVADLFGGGSGGGGGHSPTSGADGRSPTGTSAGAVAAAVEGRRSHILLADAVAALLPSSNSDESAAAHTLLVAHSPPVSSSTSSPSSASSSSSPILVIVTSECLKRHAAALEDALSVLRERAAAESSSVGGTQPTPARRTYRLAVFNANYILLVLSLRASRASVLMEGAAVPLSQR